MTEHGRPVVVLMSREEFDRLRGDSVSLVEFMQQSPLFDREDIRLERERSSLAGSDSATAPLAS